MCVYIYIYIYIAVHRARKSCTSSSTGPTARSAALCSSLTRHKLSGIDIASRPACQSVVAQPGIARRSLCAPPHPCARTPARPKHTEACLGSHGFQLLLIVFKSCPAINYSPNN